MTLDLLNLDNLGIIRKVGGEDILKRRLLDLGFIPGVEVKCVLVSPFRDPKAYLVNSNVIALRNKDAKYIEVNDGI